MPDCWLRLNLEKAHFSDDAIWKSPNCQFVTSQLFFWKNHMFLAMPSKIAKLPVFYFEIQIWKNHMFLAMPSKNRQTARLLTQKFNFRKITFTSTGFWQTLRNRVSRGLFFRVPSCYDSPNWLSKICLRMISRYKWSSWLIITLNPNYKLFDDNQSLTLSLVPVLENLFTLSAAAQ